MAGLGKRFSDEGYTTTKPLINVSGKTMVEQAVRDLPETENYLFVLRAKMKNSDQISKVLKESYPNCRIIEIPSITEGQACTAQIGIKELENDDGPIIFGACDNGAIYDPDSLKEILDSDYDLIVWGVRGYINAKRNPKSYGWLKCQTQDIQYASVKQPLDNPESDPVILGTFIFKDVKTCNSIINSLIDRDGRVNNEFYLDSCINDAVSMNLSVKYFEVEHYLCWGTPNDLKTFEYWQSCFSKWDSHPYKLKEDKMIPANKLEEIEKKYNEFNL